MSRTCAIVQARAGSSRLPGKVLEDIAGEPMLWRVVERVRRARRVDETVVATSDLPADDAVAALCRSRGVPCFRGSAEDVLDRFHRAAEAFGAGTVVRVTADCPLIDPAVVDRVVDRFRAGDCDYASNVLSPTYPDGLDVEVFSAAALAEAWRNARRPAEREHVTPYIRASGRFRVAEVRSGLDPRAGAMRWTVDQAEDLAFVRAVYARAPRDRPFGLEDVMDLVRKDPALAGMNAGIPRNEGYYRSILQEPPVAPRPRRLDRSMALKARAEKVIPSCSQTFSKAPTQFVGGVAPVFVQKASGCRVTDVDGNDYIDYPMALGPIILGHGHPAVTAAVRRQLEDGTVFSLPHPLEVELAELLCRTIPCAEMARFGKNGSDATAGAVRAARAFTGRDVVVCCGYHGWQDWYIGTTTRAGGVPAAVRELTATFAYNDLESLRRALDAHAGRVAAVVMEPVGVEEPKPGFLEGVRDLARAAGALLVFDEVVTGFRLHMGGAQAFFGVKPDLACFGKAVANGFPLSVVAGRADVMRVFDEIFFSFTFGGEALSLAAALATVKEMAEKDVVAHLWRQGQVLKDGYNALARAFGLQDHTDCVGLAPRTLVRFRDAAGKESLLLKSLFQQECIKRGVLFAGAQNLCLAHGDAEVEETLRVYRSALPVLAEAIKSGKPESALEGKMVEPVFRRP